MVEEVLDLPEGVWAKVSAFCDAHNIEQKRFIAEAILQYLYDNDYEAREKLRVKMLKRKSCPVSISSRTL